MSELKGWVMVDSDMVEISIATDDNGCFSIYEASSNDYWDHVTTFDEIESNLNDAIYTEMSIDLDNEGVKYSGIESIINWLMDNGIEDEEYEYGE